MYKCDWCLKIIPDCVLIEGMCFCINDKCEDNYYDDRAQRKRDRRLPLFIERDRQQLEQIKG